MSLGQDLAFSPATLRGASPFPPIWRIWPDAANFGIRRRRCDSPVSQFTQNFPPALNWVERFAEEHLDQEHRSLNLKALSSSFSIARYLIIDWKQELAFLWQSRCIELKLGSCWHIRNCNRCGLENIDEHLAPATSM